MQSLSNTWVEIARAAYKEMGRAVGLAHQVRMGHVVPSVVEVCTRRLGDRIAQDRVDRQASESLGVEERASYPGPDPAYAERVRQGEWICDRCGDDMWGTIMSFFNRDFICTACKDDEIEAPNYELARLIENGAVLAGNYPFEGIGLAPEDEEYLAGKREIRHAGG